VHAGSVEDVGVGDGKHYSVNVPLQEGMDDESYRFMFEPIMQKVWVIGNSVQGSTQDCAYLTSGDECSSYHIHIWTHMCFIFIYIICKIIYTLIHICTYIYV